MKGNNDHVTGFLDYYCSSEERLEYAVLLKGSWGAGKTHFMRGFIRKKNYRFVLVSLYGVSKVSEIDALLLSGLLQKHSKQRWLQEKNVLVRILIKPFQYIWSGILKVSNFFVEIGGNVPGVSKYLKFSKTGKFSLKMLLKRKKYILVFDDFERCDIPVQQKLGYINSFVEFDGQKVIILSDEDKIEESEYKKVKEKLIGKTFLISPNLLEALELFLSETQNPELQKFLEENIEIVESVFEDSGFNNIRLLKQSLWDFERFFECLEKKIRKEEILVKKLLELFLIYSLEVKKGNLEKGEVKRLTSYKVVRAANKESPWGNSEPEATKEEKKLAKIFKKYKSLGWLNTVLPTELWEKIIFENIIDSDKINGSLRQETSQREPHWKQLWHLWGQSDEQFEKNLEVVTEKFFKGEYKVLGELMHVTLTLLGYADDGLLNKTKKEVLNQGKLCIDAIPVDDFNIEDLRFHGYAGLGFWGDENPIPEQKELWEYLGSKKPEVMEERANIIISKAFANMDKDPDKFRRLVGIKEEHRYMQFPVMNRLNVEELFKKLISLPAKTQREIMGHGIKDRYQNTPTYPQIIEELPWLGNLKELFERESKVRKGKLSGHHFSVFSSELRTIVKDLQQIQSTQKECEQKKG